MEYIVVCGVALLVSALTLVSGFGLGTLLMPAFALFFPISTAVAATAVVHLANNIFKVILVGRNANKGVLLRFALPAVAAAFVGAALLSTLATLPTLAQYELGGQTHQITVAKVIMGLLITLFALIELFPSSNKRQFDGRYLVVGGLLSGFFGGLSGHQGALRSAFLIRAGLSKEAFVGTGAVAAAMIDISRLSVYGYAFYTSRMHALEGPVVALVMAASAAAFVGAFTGKQLLKKITFASVQRLVGGMLIVVGAALATGLV